MSLYTTKLKIREVASNFSDYFDYYDQGIKDKSDKDKPPGWISGTLLESEPKFFVFNFKTGDFILTKREEEDSVLSESLIKFKQFIFALEVAGITDSSEAIYTNYEEDQLVGWEVENINIYNYPRISKC